MSRSELPRSALRVLIVDRHEVSRAAIRALLRTEGAEVIADVPTRAEALAAGHAMSPDVVVVDLGIDVRDAIVTAEALAGLPSAPAVVLTSSTMGNSDLGGHAFVPKPDICARGLRDAMRERNHHSEETTQMSMQAYLDNITAKTGKQPEELVELAREAGLLEPGVKPAQIVSWLKDEYGLGRGHAMAIVSMIEKVTGAKRTGEEKLRKHFAGRRSGWRPVYDELVKTVDGFGPDTDVLPGGSYLSLRRAGKKFGIVQVTAERLDIGIKLKDTQPAGRLERAGSWNSMVTHRVRVHAAEEIDAELLGWLERAYASV